MIPPRPETQRSEKASAFTRVLFSYYAKYGRSMAWRRTRDPYRILVSEIMLQQTQVDRVREKYKEFLARFPNVEELAEASLGDVLRVWKGLGYNRRAKYLHECARALMRDGGKFPQTMEGMTELPGIGRSTAAGVLSFSKNLPEPMIDTNVRRVLSRVFFSGKPPSDAMLYDFAKTLIPKGRGREWNYAILDLAAQECRARSHGAACPLNRLHGAIREDRPKKKDTIRFEDSDRFARGKMIDLLRVEGKASLVALGKASRRDQNDAKRLIASLVHDGLVVKDGRTYRLP